MESLNSALSKPVGGVAGSVEIPDNPCYHVRRVMIVIDKKSSSTEPAIFLRLLANAWETELIALAVIETEYNRGLIKNKFRFVDRKIDLTSVKAIYRFVSLKIKGSLAQPMTRSHRSPRLRDPKPAYQPY